MHLQFVQSLRLGNAQYMDAYVRAHSAHARITQKNKDQWKRVLLYISELDEGEVPGTSMACTHSTRGTGVCMRCRYNQRLHTF